MDALLCSGYIVYSLLVNYIELHTNISGNGLSVDHSTDKLNCLDVF